MNRNKAEALGYRFQGTFDHDKDKVKARAADLRSQGNKAIVVNEPPSKLSRGNHGMGYAVYWIESDANVATRMAKDRELKLNGLLGRKASLLADLDEVNVQIDALKGGM